MTVLAIAVDEHSASLIAMRLRMDGHAKPGRFAQQCNRQTIINWVMCSFMETYYKKKREHS